MEVKRAYIARAMLKPCFVDGENTPRVKQE
jgi:hypothetical protein